MQGRPETIRTRVAGYKRPVKPLDGGATHKKVASAFKAFEPVFLTTLTLVLEKEAAVATSTVEAQVRDVIDGWADALRGKDAAGVVSLRTEDFVQFALAPPLQAEALDRKALEDWFSSWEGPIDYEIREQKITTADDMAFSHSLNRMRATTTDGEQTDLWFRQTLCFRKLGAGWKIAHEHDSVPFYMDDARAAIDLQP